ncbi:MAG: hypothetical protein DRO18_04295 [Thermoprotei archaeon]|nr:MAG: hypothetical protein DRO18_04295 [Thermoprotei archaeon]
MEKVKRYYIEEERYDWVEVAEKFRGLEAIFLRNRRRFINKTLRKFSKGYPILDAGCGSGLILMELPMAVGLDINPWAIGKALKRCVDGQCLIIGDLECLPLRYGVFRTVICTEVIEHLLNPVKALREMWRTLRPCGVLIGSVPCRSFLRIAYLILKSRGGLFDRILTAVFPCPSDVPFHNYYSKDEVEEMLRKFFKRVVTWTSIFGLNVVFACQKEATRPSPCS